MNVFNTLPDDKITYTSNLKAFADDNTNTTKKLKFVFGMVENTVGKRGRLPAFSFSNNVFKKLLFQGC